VTTAHARALDRVEGLAVLVSVVASCSLCVGVGL